MAVQSIKVMTRGDDGSEIECLATDLNDAEKVARMLRSVENRTVAIVVDGVRQKRWQRIKTAGENRNSWRFVGGSGAQIIQKNG